MKMKTSLLALALALALLTFLSFVSAPNLARAQAQPSPQPSQTSAPPSGENNPAAAPKPEQAPNSAGAELTHETRESTGAEEEEHADLKHSSMVQLLARKTGLTVHHAHLVALFFNFALIVAIVAWAARRSVPGWLRNRSALIQRALEEARAASQDASRRLADIENRLRQLDVEIGQMQASAEKEAEAEELRIHKAAEEDLRKVVLAAEQEIVAAAKQVRRELTTHTANLAIALARQQINVDSNTDQVLVRTFASKLVAHNDGGGHNDGGKGGQ